jgi:hypothetical protein
MKEWFHTASFNSEIWSLNQFGVRVRVKVRVRVRVRGQMFRVRIRVRFRVRVRAGASARVIRVLGWLGY